MIQSFRICLQVLYRRVSIQSSILARDGLFNLGDTIMDLVTSIADYEAGLLSNDETIALFAELVRTGLAWSLQGSYGRTAVAMQNAGLI